MTIARAAVSRTPKAVPEYSANTSQIPSSSSCESGIIGLSSRNYFPEYDRFNVNAIELPLMAPPPRRDLLHKDHFAFVFESAKTQNYFDPAAKGPGSHT
jgi:hypothetical protein